MSLENNQDIGRLLSAELEKQAPNETVLERLSGIWFQNKEKEGHNSEEAQTDGIERYILPGTNIKQRRFVIGVPGMFTNNIGKEEFLDLSRQDKVKEYDFMAMAHYYSARNKESVQLVYRELIILILEIAKEGYDICVCGHSFGGVIGKAAVDWVKKNFPEINIGLITYASPHKMVGFLNKNCGLGAIKESIGYTEKYTEDYPLVPIHCKDDIWLSEEATGLVDKSGNNIKPRIIEDANHGEALKKSQGIREIERVIHHVFLRIERIRKQAEREHRDLLNLTLHHVALKST